MVEEAVESALSCHIPPQLLATRPAKLQRSQSLKHYLKRVGAPHEASRPASTPNAGMGSCFQRAASWQVRGRLFAPRPDSARLSRCRESPAPDIREERRFSSDSVPAAPALVGSPASAADRFPWCQNSEHHKVERWRGGREEGTGPEPCSSLLPGRTGLSSGSTLL